MCISEVTDISPSNLNPACALSSLAFHMMYSAYKLISRVTIYSLDLLLSQLEPIIFPCPVLTVVS